MAPSALSRGPACLWRARRQLSFRGKIQALLDSPSLRRLHVDVFVMPAADDAVRLAVFADVQRQRVSLSGGAIRRRFNPWIGREVADIQRTLPGAMLPRHRLQRVAPFIGVGARLEDTVSREQIGVHLTPIRA